MLSNVTIRGFRSFRELSVQQLTRVNLLVGANGSGKTSLLDAVELLLSGVPSTLLESTSRRGEFRYTGEGEGSVETTVRHLFSGHALRSGSSFEIRAEGVGTPWVKAELAVRGWSPGEPPPSMQDGRPLVLQFQSHLLKEPGSFPLSKNGGVSLMPPFFIGETPRPIILLDSASIERSYLRDAWESIALRPDEAAVLEALRLVEPRAERLAFVGDTSHKSQGILVKLEDSLEPLPVGTLGGGFWQLLVLALHLVRAKGGTFLVDEIDTGLHYSILTPMWRLLVHTAARMECQVFATTHSLDCVKALARLFETDRALAEQVSVHRLQKNVSKTMRYAAEEVHLAAREQIEVR